MTSANCLKVSHLFIMRREFDILSLKGSGSSLYILFLSTHIISMQYSTSRLLSVPFSLCAFLRNVMYRGNGNLYKSEREKDLP